MSTEQMSGISHLTGYENDVPLFTGMTGGDIFAGVMGANALFAAVHHRNRSGQGQGHGFKVRNHAERTQRIDKGIGGRNGNAAAINLKDLISKLQANTRCVSEAFWLFNTKTGKARRGRC